MVESNQRKKNARGSREYDRTDKKLSEVKEGHASKEPSSRERVFGCRRKMGMEWTFTKGKL